MPIPKHFIHMGRMFSDLCPVLSLCLNAGSTDTGSKCVEVMVVVGWVDLRLCFFTVNYSFNYTVKVKFFFK